MSIVRIHVEHGMCMILLLLLVRSTYQEHHFEIVPFSTLFSLDQLTSTTSSVQSLLLDFIDRLTRSTPSVLFLFIDFVD